MKVASLFLSLIVVAASGCGESLPPTVKLSGTVKLNGKMLSEGRISFHPADKEGGSPVSAPIVDGMYLAPVVPKGTYRASFSSDSVAPPSSSGPVDSTYGLPPPGDKMKKDPIPEKYRKPTLPVDAVADRSDLNFELSGS